MKNLAWLMLVPGWLQSPDGAPALADPAGITSTVNVSTVAQLQAAVAALASNQKIVIAAGTYNVTQILAVPAGTTNAVIRGATGNRADVVIQGPGMADSSVPHGIYTSGATGLVVADLSIGGFYYHPLALYDVQQVHVYNVRVFDAGQQLLKSNPTAGATQFDGRVEYCVFEYTTTAPSDYTNGVDVHRGANWRIGHCLFRNIRAPAGSPIAGPAVLMWNQSSNTTVEGNRFLNCQRGIALGFNSAVSNDHVGGVIRNNFFHRAASQSGDTAIYLGPSAGTQILNNTCILSGTYSTPIEYRWTATTGVSIANNLLDGTIWARDGATGTLQTNVTSASAALFVDAAGGDLHLVSTATAAIDHGTTVAGCTDDWDAGARSGANDIGADEYGSTGGGPPPPPPPTTTSDSGGGKKKRNCFFCAGGWAGPGLLALAVTLFAVRRRQ
jgi:hypothetical protein